jgi:hypothetical protein
MSGGAIYGFRFNPTYMGGGTALTKYDDATKAEIVKVAPVKDGITYSSAPATYTTNVDTAYKAVVANSVVNGMAQSFLNKFNMTDTLKRNEDMAETIKNPGARMTQINQELTVLSAKMANVYASKYTEISALGYGPDSSEQITNEYVQGLLDSEMSILRKKYPYSFEQQGVIKELVRQSKELQLAR